MGVTVTLTNSEFKDEVRTALGELGPDIISDSMIIQQKERYVIPNIEDNGVDGSSTKIDNAVIAKTAERCFKAWLKKSQVSSGQANLSLNTKEHKKDLEEQASRAMNRLESVTSAPGSEGTAFVSSTDGWL